MDDRDDLFYARWILANGAEAFAAIGAMLGHGGIVVMITSSGFGPLARNWKATPSGMLSATPGSSSTISPRNCASAVSALAMRDSSAFPSSSTLLLRQPRRWG